MGSIIGKLFNRQDAVIKPKNNQQKTSGHKPSVQKSRKPNHRQQSKQRPQSDHKLVPSSGVAKPCWTS